MTDLIYPTWLYPPWGSKATPQIFNTPVEAMPVISAGWSDRPARGPAPSDKATIEPPPDDPQVSDDALDGMTKEELTEFAGKMGIKVAARWNKTEIRDAILEEMTK